MQATCPQCTKMFEGPNAEIVVDPKRHCWILPSGKRVFCADATPEQLAEYKVVVDKVKAHRARLRAIEEEERKKAEGK